MEGSWNRCSCWLDCGYADVAPSLSHAGNKFRPDGSVKRLAATLASIVSERLELLANELQEERLRLAQVLLFYLYALFCFGMGVLLLAVFIVMLSWDDHRLAELAKDMEQLEPREQLGP